MGIKKFNKGTVEFTNLVDHEEFKKLEDLYNEGIKTFKVNGVFLTKDFGYGIGCFINSDDYNVSLPNNMAETVSDIMQDSEAVDEINSGIVIAEIYEYEMKKYKGRKFYNINFDTKF